MFIIDLLTDLKHIKTNMFQIGDNNTINYNKLSKKQLDYIAEQVANIQKKETVSKNFKKLQDCFSELMLHIYVLYLGKGTAKYVLKNRYNFKSIRLICKQINDLMDELNEKYYAIFF